MDDNILQSFPLRLTSQLDQKQQADGVFNWATSAKMRIYVDRRRGRQPSGRAQPAEYIAQAKWTSTLTSQLLLEAGYNLTNHHVVYYVSSREVVRRRAATCVRALCAGHQLRQHRAPGHPDRRGLDRAVSRHRRRAGTETGRRNRTRRPSR